MYSSLSNSVQTCRFTRLSLCRKALPYLVEVASIFSVYKSAMFLSTNNFRISASTHSNHVTTKLISDWSSLITCT